MAFGVGDLIKSVTSQIQGALQSLGFGEQPTQPYPNQIGGGKKPIQTITNMPQWNDGSWRESKGYEFAVVRISEKGKVLEKNDTGFKTFRLQINPQELTQDEVFAIAVTPTFRGVLVEHQGVTLKEITISGTTGLSPKRVDGGAKRTDGSPVLAAGRSGYQEFHELRSYFRAYVEAKRLDRKGTLRMIFRNLRDAESLYVEPQKFTMKRSARRATLYDYVIQLKGIGVADNPEGDGGYSGPLSDIVNAIDKALGYMEYGRQIMVGSVGLLRRVERDVTNTVLNPLRTINEAMVQMRGGKAALFGEYGVTRLSALQLKSEMERIEGNYADLIGRDNTAYNEATGRTVTTISPTGQRESTYQELQLLNGIQNVKKGLSVLLSEKKLFEEDANKQTDEVSSQYNSRTLGEGEDGEIVFGLSPNSNFNISKPNSVKTATIDGNDTIQTIAARELGDPDRFKEIVILNNLKPPYISDTPGPNVLSPGSAIKIPQSDALGQSTGTLENIIYQITKYLNQAERNLGVDLRLTVDNDLAVSNTGDLDMLAGVDNMAQAILLKLGLDTGSLQRHPEIGAGLKIGIKTVASNLNEIRDKINTSLSNDGRVESIPYLQLRQEGGTTYIDMVVRLKNLNQPVPIPLVL
jgi:hypothetical protein